MKKKKKRKKILIARDPTYGKTQGRAGPHLTKKDKLRNRKSKDAKRKLRKELNDQD